MLSIIIPTLNSGKYFRPLLSSIKNQDFSDYEIIVSDGGSVDDTLEIAKEYGCKIIEGGLPAKGRNQGAAHAKGELLLFLDAEANLPDGFLSKLLEEFEKRDLDVATCAHAPIQEDWMPRFARISLTYDIVYNWPAKMLEKVFPFSATLILTKKEIHDRIGGFDEEIWIAEDHDYSRRIAKQGRYGFLLYPKVPLFLRRMQKEGLLRVNLKYIGCNIMNVFGMTVKKDIFKYYFGQYNEIDGERKKANPINQLLWYSVAYSAIAFVFVMWLVVFTLFSPLLLFFNLKDRFKNRKKSIKI